MSERDKEVERTLANWRISASEGAVVHCISALDSMQEAGPSVATFDFLRETQRSGLLCENY